MRIILGLYTYMVYTSVFAYGWFLAEVSYLKWTMVLSWAIFQPFLYSFTRDALKDDL